MLSVSVWVATIWVVALWSASSYVAWRVLERYETEVVITLRLNYNRAHTADDWHELKRLLVYWGPFTLLFILGEWLRRRFS